MKTLLEIFENELDNVPNILNEKNNTMKKTELNATLLAFGFVGLVSVVFFAFVVSPTLGVGLLATGGFVSMF
jgi:hypothetical protein